MNLDQSMSIVHWVEYIPVEDADTYRHCEGRNPEAISLQGEKCRLLRSRLRQGFGGRAARNDEEGLSPMDRTR